MTDQQPPDPDGQPTAPVPTTPPPYSPPPYSPPPYSPPPYGAPPYGPPPYGAPLGAPTAPTAPAVQPPKRSRTGLVIAGIVVVVLLVGGAIAAGVLMTRSSGSLELTVARCEIAADGTLSASGVVAGPDGIGVEVEVTFVDTATGAEVDSADTGVDLSFGSSGTPWSVTGTAGDDVRKVRCDVTADD